jgi:DNA polymerase III delta prime subunit
MYQQVVKVEADREGACKSMNRAQKYLAQANRHIAEFAVQIVRQRVIVKHALDTGQRSEMAESLLDALEKSLRIFEKHRIFLLSCSGSSSALPPKTPRG